ncbi:MAG: TIGR02597 family protein [Opitutales bacterium]|nr:TIGR02597 family protein [Opitutales bacterium]
MKTSVKILSAACAALALAGAGYAAPIWGAHKISCPANSDTYIGVISTRGAAFSGKVQSVQSGTSNIIPQSEPNWTPNQFVYSAGVQPNRYYLKFTSGELEGAWYDISSNGAYYAAIEIGAGELAKISAGDSFEIIPHWTMSTLFPDGGGFVKSTKVAMGAGASVLYKFSKYENGVIYPQGTNRAAPESYFYRERGSTSKWLNSDKADASDDVVEPNAVFKVVQPDEESEAAIIGEIPMCATSFEVFTTEESGEVATQDIFVAAPAATDITLSELTECLVDTGIFAASTGVVNAPVDTFYIYSNGNAGKNLVADKTCYYRARGATNKWLDSDKADANSAQMKAATAIKIRKKAGEQAVSYRCKFTPSYISK